MLPVKPPSCPTPLPLRPAGHPESHIHSGEGAVISPLAVAALGRRQVAVVAAGKHHTLLCTTAGASLLVHAG